MIKKIRGILDQITEINSSRRHLFFFAVVLAFTLLFLPALTRLYNLSVSSEMYSHLVLIPLVSIYLVYLRRKEAFPVLHPALLFSVGTGRCGRTAPGCRNSNI